MMKCMTIIWGQFHRAAKQGEKNAYQKNLLRQFLWLPANFSCNILVGSLFYIAEQKYLLSKILCLTAV